MIDFSSDQSTVKLDYPAEFHFRIICDADVDITESINTLLATCTVTKELAESHSSRSGKYRSFSISVKFNNRSEMIIFDKAVKAISGVRMLL